MSLASGTECRSRNLPEKRVLALSNRSFRTLRLSINPRQIASALAVAQNNEQEVEQSAKGSDESGHVS